jgi:hypothetical protein
MPNSLFFSLAALAAVFMIALASVYPQGIGARSPRPFGHETAARMAAKVKKSATPGAKGASTQIVLRGPM